MKPLSVTLVRLLGQEIELESFFLLRQRVICWCELASAINTIHCRITIQVKKESLTHQHDRPAVRAVILDNYMCEYMLLQIKRWEIFFKHFTINSFIYYFKKLDAEQMELLIGSAGACNPLWLSLSCEELRVFGVFETITRHIRSLPATLKELLQFIMNRLTNEDQEKNIYKVFYFWVAASIGSISATLWNPVCWRSSFPNSGWSSSLPPL